VNWELLLKYINKESDDSENLQVESWLNEQAENVQLLNYLQRRQEQLEQPLKQTDIDEQWQRLLNRIFETPAKGNSNPFRPYRFMGIAASLLLISIVSWIYLYTTKFAQNDQQFTLQTAVNMRGKLTLPDGTEVYMAPKSKITYNSTFGTNKRVVHLSGEAFFNVLHNTHKPFIIYTENNLAVTVLGTSFNVYARGNNQATEVKVASGLVGVTENRHTHLLQAGQQFNYLANHPIIIKKVAHNDAAALQKETLFFENNNADEIAERLQRWYNISVQVLPSARKHPRFSGEMKDTGINNLMKGLEYATGINYQRKNSHTIVLF
jgi:ferric-dicitrate binding protein FerR (iron transport regulator)